jgi:hypothetical protein
MDENIRFFWREGEAILPFNVIPKGERQPLRVRLGILQDQVPEVVQHLKQGRHVAAAWPSGKQILLIGCHPNIARGSADSVCLDTISLPQVVLKLGSWDEASEAAQLLLAAFGGEALDEQEMLNKRLALIDWLVKRNQNDTAAIIRRYLMFPIKPLGLISRVGLRTAAAMKAFTDVAGGQWPSPESAEPAWRHFVITAFHEDVAFEPEELTRWFRTNGWDADAAAELTKRFSAEAAFLAEYEEARPA